LRGEELVVFIRRRRVSEVLDNYVGLLGGATVEELKRRGGGAGTVNNAFIVANIFYNILSRQTWLEQPGNP